MFRSSSRDGLQSIGDRGFALPGALRRCFRHIFAAGSQEYRRKLVAFTFRTTEVLKDYFLPRSRKVTDRGLAPRSHCATSRVMMRAPMLVVRVFRVPRTEESTGAYRRLARSQVAEPRLVRKLCVSPTLGLTIHLYLIKSKNFLGRTTGFGNRHLYRKLSLTFPFKITNPICAS